MLTLPIKRKWFDMILSGEKKEEYREATEYYRRRFTNLFNAFDIDKQYIRFRNRYRSDSPTFTAACTWNIKAGREEWGAEQGKEYYTLTIHEIKERSGC